ncbi:BTB/POZ domain-containing protein At4g30940-like [Nicotiana tomentosiformis]|uniref:BTB/POZ domain-containing protein At4g30940-like n=1 Tax=Nicotiana tomentosiformis TaxID=4098 RepID=UPI00051BC553|nr:BTB/POZ domain-containing protein At4g30940-like [Nicotiana tomentosiformis]
MESQKDRVKFNVGGRIFETTATTLAGAGRNSFFGAMFDENWNLHSNATTNEHFIDRDPDYFAVILNLLRTGKLYIPPKIDKKFLYREALYYGLLDHVRSAECAPFDGNRLRLAQSITGQSVGDDVGTTQAIRASPSGWCCVAQGSVVRVYDWMLEEHPTINLDYHKVNDVCWVDSENIVASFDRKLASGSIGLFNVSTGKLRYKHQVTNQLKDYTAGTLCFYYKLSSNCKSSSNNEYRIGVWDHVTGKLINIVVGKRILGNDSKLQWYDTNCLMIASFYPLNQNCCIGLFDIREKALVWSWSGSAWEQRNQYPVSQQLRKFRDVIIIKESNSICVVDDNGCLGFIDLRSTTKSVEWRESCTPITAVDNRPCYPKLGFHEGQLFSSMNDTISVYSGPNWLLTSQLRQSRGGPICDFSIGGTGSSRENSIL